MGRIFILSHAKGLKKIIGERSDYLGLDSLCCLPLKHGIEHDCNKQHTLYYNSDKNIFQSEEITNSKIIIIHDFSYLTEIEKFRIIDGDYLLHHNDGDVSDVKIYSEKFDSNTKKGRHEDVDKHLYAPVFRKIFDNTILPQNKADEIIKFLFPEEERKRNLDLALRYSRAEKSNTDNETIKK